MPQFVVQLLLLGTVAHIATAGIPGFPGGLSALKQYQFSDDIPEQPHDVSIPDAFRTSRFVRSPADPMGDMQKKPEDMKDQGMDMKDKASEMSKKFGKSRFVRSSPPFSVDEIIKKAFEMKDKAMEMKNIATGMSGSARNENARFVRSVGYDGRIILANFLSPRRERREARGSGGKMPTKQG